MDKNFYAELVNTTKKAKSEYEIKKQEYFEITWNWLKNLLIYAAKEKKTEIIIYRDTIRANEIYNDELFPCKKDTILDNSKEIVLRLHLLGFCSNNIEVTEINGKTDSIKISWEG